MTVAAIRNGAANSRNSPQVERITNANAIAPRAGFRCATSTTPNPTAPAANSQNSTCPTRSAVGLPKALTRKAAATGAAADRLVEGAQELLLVEHHLLAAQPGQVVQGGQLDGVHRAGLLAHAAVD